MLPNGYDTSRDAEFQLTYNALSIKEDGSPCSVFTFDISSNNSRTPLARNAVRKSRTLRHPGVIKVLDTIEVLEILGRTRHRT